MSLRQTPGGARQRADVRHTGARSSTDRQCWIRGLKPAGGAKGCSSQRSHDCTLSLSIMPVQTAAAIAGTSAAAQHVPQWGCCCQPASCRLTDKHCHRRPSPSVSRATARDKATRPYRAHRRAAAMSRKYPWTLAALASGPTCATEGAQLNGQCLVGGLKKAGEAHDCFSQHSHDCITDSVLPVWAATAGANAAAQRTPQVGRHCCQPALGYPTGTKAVAVQVDQPILPLMVSRRMPRRHKLHLKPEAISSSPKSGPNRQRKVSLGQTPGDARQRANVRHTGRAT